MRINNVCFWRVQALGGNAWGKAWNLFLFDVTTQDISKEWAWSTKILSFHAKLVARDEACTEPSPDIAALFERIFAAATFYEENKTILHDFVKDGANIPNALDITVSSSFCVNFGHIGLMRVDDIERYPTTAIRDEVL
jgi:hypothetical protein